MCGNVEAIHNFEIGRHACHAYFFHVSLKSLLIVVQVRSPLDKLSILLTLPLAASPS